MVENPSLPHFASWPTFPFEGDLCLKPLDDAVAVEPPRHGENPAECLACTAPDEAYIWVSERWRVRSLDRPTGLPMVLILEPRSHLDLGDLPNMLAAELGVLTVRIERAMRSLDGVARVHVNRWGDGAFHLHVWFLARPHGQLQLRGTFLSLWNELLPPIAEEPWRENLALIAAWLEEFGGKALVEPPRIHWTAPSVFSSDASEATDGTYTGVGASTDSSADSNDASPAGETGVPSAEEPASEDTGDRAAGSTAEPSSGVTDDVSMAADDASASGEGAASGEGEIGSRE